MTQILVSKLICDDGVILHSRYRWDYQEHIDSNGKQYILDGGNEPFIRTNGNGKRLVITTDDPHSLIREHFEWTRNFDADMNKLPEPEVILLKDITDDHLEALLDWTAEGYPKYIHRLFINEWNYREGNNG